MIGEISNQLGTIGGTPGNPSYKFILQQTFQDHYLLFLYLIFSLGAGKIKLSALNLIITSMYVDDILYFSSFLIDIVYPIELDRRGDF